MQRFYILLAVLVTATFTGTIAVRTHALKSARRAKVDAPPTVASAGTGAVLLAPIQTAAPPSPSGQQQNAPQTRSLNDAGNQSYLPTSPPSEVIVAQATLESSDVRARLGAVHSLRSMGLQDDSAGYVRAALRAAMQDSDPVIKFNAETAYDMLTARYGEAPK